MAEPPTTSVAANPASTRQDAPVRGPAGAGRPAARRRFGSVEILTAGLVLLAVLQRWLVGLFDIPAVQTWSTIFVAIIVQAIPFLVLGVLLSASIAAFVPASFLTRALPRRATLAVPVAGVAGVVLPGCECASVPVAGRLVSRGAAPAAALAFLLSAPAINPVVLVSTAVAFPQVPQMVVARFLASLGVAVVMGWLWARFGRPGWLRPPPRPYSEGLGRVAVFRRTAQHDFLHAGGFLVVGGITAATLNVVVPRDLLDSVAASGVLSILALAALAVVLAICSEADAFVAASLSQFSLTARLAFLVVGPAVDVKLIALQSGTFGRRFAVRFAPATFVVAVLLSGLIGWCLL